MPEGDTVWLTAHRMHAALAGEVLQHTDFRVPALATTDLSGRAVRAVVARGKHLLLRVDGRSGDAVPTGLTLHSHLRMEGSWHLYRPDSRWRGGPLWQVRAVLTTADRVAVAYRMPVLEIVATGAEDRIVGHLGPDLLGADWDLDPDASLDEAVRRLGARPDREIGPALLDQRNLAGIGNVYKNEVLFIRRVHPWTPVGQVDDLAAVVVAARRLLLANRTRPVRVTTGDIRHPAFVTERGGRPCLRCGTPIASAEQGEPPYQRITWWCPRCQPAAVPGSGGTA
ncbi:MAG: Fpg/Nei family DNA glycosylase [Actinomycetota bacterium]|nr:MAG: Fpg/Nei family DNA glycosylase [Actinomycetota bacterium]